MDEDYLHRIVPPVLALLVDQDSRVRYYACEALYNIAKFARNDFMTYFAQTFDALFRLCADPDPAVGQAVTFLDNIIKVTTLRACCGRGTETCVGFQHTRRRTQ